MSDQDLIDLQEIAPAEVGEIDLYQRREKIYTRKIEGFFQRIRLFTGWPLLLGYLLLPWISWDGRQSILFDLPARKFNILGLTFWPQDFPMLAFLLIISAFALFAVTTFAGRIWCGYTCPQTVWTTIFMWLEQKTEGSRNQRIRLDKAPWSAQKTARKIAKHGSWLFVGFVTGLTFVGYFYPIKQLVPDLTTLDLNGWPLFWIAFFTIATYINAGWMREQVCMYMCPYARFQSVMFDHDTLIVSYDKRRGDPRGSRKRDADHKELGLGECIDCELCMQVCPTGIDIRNGLQYQCIAWAACIDACDDVLDKMNYDRGLVRYTTLNEVKGKGLHILRPRVYFYTAILSGLIIAMFWSLIVRVPVGLDITRDRNILYREAANGDLENVFMLKIMNQDSRAHNFIISIDGLPGATLDPDQDETYAASGEIVDTLVRVRASEDIIKDRSTNITFKITATDNEKMTDEEDARFIAPADWFQ